MTVSSVSESYFVFLDVTIQGGASPGAAAGATSPVASNSTSVSTPQEGEPELSPFAQILSQLQQLQQQNPTGYKQVTGQIATNLQSAAQSASTDGNATLASQLNQLSTDFTDASQTGQLPNIQDLAEAIGGTAHHRHGHHHRSSSTDADSTTTDTTGTATGTGSAGSASSSSGATQTQNQLVSSAYRNNAQNDSLSPLEIILDALSSAGTGSQNSGQSEQTPQG